MPAFELLRFCLSNGYRLRFIEHMPLGGSVSWQRNAIVTRKQLLEAMTSAEGPTFGTRGRPRRVPAELWEVEWDGLSGDVGIIASVTAPFCAACDRTRLTSDGQIRTCLFDQVETDLRNPVARRRKR